MKFSISGTHSSGKTTLLAELEKLEELKLENYEFLQGPTRQIKSKGFNINESGSDPTQLLCMTIDIQNIFFNQNNNFISDRCILDTYIYTKYLYIKGQISEPTMASIKMLYESLIPSFDIIFIPNHFDVDLVDDGERSINLEFRDFIYRLFMEEVNIISNIVPVYMLGGSVEKRVGSFKVIVNQHYKVKEESLLFKNNNDGRE